MATEISLAKQHISEAIEGHRAWSDYDRGWLSAVIDSEGHISLIKDSRPNFKAGCTYVPVIGIANQSLAFIERTKWLIGGGSYSLHKENRVYNYTVSPRLIASVLSHLTFVVKERQKVLVLEACVVLQRKAGRSIPRTDDEIAKLESVYQKLRVLNTRNKEAYE